MGEAFENASRRMKDKVLKLNQCIHNSDKRKLKKGGYELTVYKLSTSLHICLERA